MAASIVSQSTPLRVDRAWISEGFKDLQMFGKSFVVEN
jgi:hypothetical protein